MRGGEGGIDRAACRKAVGTNRRFRHRVASQPQLRRETDDKIT